MWMVVFLALPVLGLSYVGWHVWHVLPWGNAWRWVAVAVGVAAFLTVFLNFSRAIDRMPLWLGSAVYEIGNSAIFVLLYLAMLFLALDALRLVGIVPKAVLFGNGRTAMGIVALMAVIFVYGNVHYNNKVRQPIELKSSKLAGHKPVKVVMMSDLHLGYHNRRAELRRWVDMVNAERADLILIGGDIIDISLRPLVEQGMASELRRLNAPVYACLGNHEYYSGEQEARTFYDEAGITLLRDSVAYWGDLLCIAGRDDRTNPRRKSVSELLKTADRRRYIILLDHQPYHLERAERAGVDFQFSGHTHHGQVWPISWITEALYEDAFGPHRRGETEYYVSSGIGIWGGKFRIGTRSEYVVATIK